MWTIVGGMKRLLSRLRGASADQPQPGTAGPPAHGAAAEAPTAEDSARIATRPRWEEFEASELAHGFQLPEAELPTAPEGETRVRLRPSSPRDLAELEVILGADETVVGLSLLLDRAALDTGREAASGGARLANGLLSFVAGADPVIGQLPAHLFAGTTDPLGALEAASRAGPEADWSVRGLADLFLNPAPGEMVVAGLRLLRVGNARRHGLRRFGISWGEAARLPGLPRRFRCERCGIPLLDEQVVWRNGPEHRLTVVRAGRPPTAVTDLFRWTGEQEVRHGPVSFSGEMLRDRHMSPGERAELLPELNSLVAGGIYRWDQPDPWHFRDKIEQVMAAAYGARSRRMAQVLILVASGCPSAGDSFSYYERAIDIFGDLDGGLSWDLADTYAVLGHRRGGEARNSGRANSAEARARAARELTRAIDIWEQLLDGATPGKRSEGKLPGPPPAFVPPGPGVDLAELSRVKQELTDLRRLIP